MNCGTTSETVVAQVAQINEPRHRATPIPLRGV